jgi:hypothetical protein
VRAATASPHRIVIEDDVNIGANSVIISPSEGSLRIGRGARIGASPATCRRARRSSAPPRACSAPISRRRRPSEAGRYSTAKRPTRDSARSRRASERRNP